MLKLSIKIMLLGFLFSCEKSESENEKLGLTNENLPMSNLLDEENLEQDDLTIEEVVVEYEGFSEQTRMKITQLTEEAVGYLVLASTDIDEQRYVDCVDDLEKLINTLLLQKNCFHIEPSLIELLVLSQRFLQSLF